MSAHYYKDDAIDEAGPEAELLYVRGLAFCADVLSDGFISDRQLVRFVGVGLDCVRERADALVKAELWERDDSGGGYWVRSWLNWNRSRAEITDHHVRDAARKRKPDPPAEDENPPPPPPKGGLKTSDRTPNGIHAESDQHSNGSPNGIRPRARTPLHSNSTPTPAPEQTLPLAKLAEPDPLARFPEFWAVYPRRVDRRAAEKQWRAALKRGADPDQVIDAARRYAQAKLDIEARFIKHPATWLNADAFYNQPEPAAPPRNQADDRFRSGLDLAARYEREDDPHFAPPNLRALGGTA